MWIDVPLDVQATPIDESQLRSFDPAEFAKDITITGTANIPAEVQRAIEAFNACERPLLFAGNGIRLARAEAEFEELRQHLRIPSVATWCAADLVPSDDPTYVGRPGNVAARGANFALQNCDFLMVLGARMDMAITGYAPQNLAREAHKITVDIDQAELNKLHPHVQQPVCADAKAFLTELLKHKDQLKPKDFKPWQDRCAVSHRGLGFDGLRDPDGHRRQHREPRPRGHRRRWRRRLHVQHPGARDHPPSQPAH